MHETQVQDPPASPTFQRLQERLRELKAEQSTLLPRPDFLCLDGRPGERKLTAEQRQRLQDLELSIDKVTIALNDYCRRHGEPDWF